MLNIGTKVDGAAGATGQVNADEFNAISLEDQNAVVRSGQTLSGANLEQIAEAMAINAMSATTFVDGGTANTIELTPITGSSGIKIPTTYTLLNGARVFFFAGNANTGNVTLNIGQTAGTLLGSKKLLQKDGSEIPSGAITAGLQIQAYYDPSADGAVGAWIIDTGISSFVPTGTILAAASTTIPLGYLACEGASVSRTTYADLFAVIGTTYGNVDANTFNVPDYRGEFLRGWDNGSGNDPDAASRTDAGGGGTGDNIGTKQPSSFQGHFHGNGYSFSFTGASIVAGTTGMFGPDDSGTTTVIANKDTPISDGTHGTPSVSTESRGRNIYVRYIIKT